MRGLSALKDSVLTIEGIVSVVVDMRVCNQRESCRRTAMIERSV